MTIRISYRGNFQPDLPPGVIAWSTEHHLAKSLESLGHEVVRVQENQVDWATTYEMARGSDMLLWTSTFGYAESWPREEAITTLMKLDAEMVTCGVHLDLWYGLARAVHHGLVGDAPLSPFFRCRHVFTPDGGHDELWEQAGVRHHWLPPGVFHEEAFDGLPDSRFFADVAFVGSWRSYGHAEHEPTRLKMLNVLRKKYSKRFKCFPQRQAIRGSELNDLYASVRVVVGDSCLAGQVSHYWSDRIPETTGRGGFLIHPYVTGLLNTHPDLVTFEPGNWDELISKVDHYLENNDAREANRRMNSDWTRTHHTYKHRMQTVLDTVGVA